MLFPTLVTFTFDSAQQYVIRKNRYEFFIKSASACTATAWPTPTSAPTWATASLRRCRTSMSQGWSGQDWGHPQSHCLGIEGLNIAVLNLSVLGLPILFRFITSFKQVLGKCWDLASSPDPWGGRRSLPKGPGRRRILVLSALSVLIRTVFLCKQHIMYHVTRNGTKKILWCQNLKKKLHLHA